MKPFTVASPRKRKDGKTFWVRMGAAWPRDDGGFKVDLDALPLPDAEGKVTLLISPPREDQEGAGYTPGPRQAKAEYPGGGPMGGLDDSEIPFGAEWRA